MFCFTGIAQSNNNPQCQALDYPYCVYDSASYTDQTAFDACKSKVEKFNAEQKTYTACLKTLFENERQALSNQQTIETEQMSARQQADMNVVVNKGNQLIKTFNCMQEKNKSCY